MVSQAGVKMRSTSFQVAVLYYYYYYHYHYYYYYSCVSEIVVPRCTATYRGFHYALVKIDLHVDGRYKFILETPPGNISNRLKPTLLVMYMAPRMHAKLF
jgi:hypothetical protein